MDNIQERVTGGLDQAREAFNELCAMAGALESERELKRGLAVARFEAMRTYTMRLREKHRALRARYINMVEMYNALAEEAHNRSDSSSSSDEERDDNCSIIRVMLGIDQGLIYPKYRMYTAATALKSRPSLYQGHGGGIGCDLAHFMARTDLEEDTAELEAPPPTPASMGTNDPVFSIPGATQAPALVPVSDPSKEVGSVLDHVASFQEDGAFSTKSALVYKPDFSQDLRDMSVCTWFKFYRLRGTLNFMVSYATKGNNNELTLELKRNTEAQFVPMGKGGTLVLGQDQDWEGDGFDAYESFSGELSQMELWDHALEPEKIKLMATCQVYEHGNVVDWEQIDEWESRNVSFFIIEREELCRKSLIKDVVLLEQKLSHEEVVEVCDLLRGTLEVPTTRIQLEAIVQFQEGLILHMKALSQSEKVSECVFNTNYTTFHLGQTSLDGKHWINPYTNEMVQEQEFFQDYEPIYNQPVCLYNRGVYLDSTLCSNRVACGYCLLKPKTVIRLKGLCRTAIVSEQEFDTKYFAFGNTNSRPHFRGFMNSDIYYDPVANSWKIESFRNKNEHLLFKASNSKTLPLGRHDWTIGINGSVCNLQQKETIRLTFSVCATAEFTCNSGDCVPISKKCNSQADCRDKSDEYGCSYLHVGNDYSKNTIPRASDLEPLRLFMNVSVVAFPSIDSVNLKFTSDLFLNLRWRDPRITYSDLNSASLLNSLSMEDMARIWTPNMIFVNALGPYRTVVDEQTTTLIIVEDDPLLEDMTQPIEAMLFAGANNSIYMTREYYQDNSCDFNLRFYPFDSQMCKLEFLMQGVTNEFARLIQDGAGVEFTGTRMLVEYEIQAEDLEITSTDNISLAVVRFVFRRRMEYHVTNTFLQTFILICIGYMSLHFDVDNFSDRIMVTLTTMLVIATITASIQQGLPKTSYYKLIDWWLLFSMNALVLTMCFHTGIAHLCYKAKRAASPGLIHQGYRTRSAAPSIASVEPKMNGLFHYEDFRHHYYYKYAHRVNFLGKVVFIGCVVIFN
eukprot:maker-scaffold1140_size60066-snap-gene-0.4 protein:Tk09466 transcript:maker-scaffold1140_size60066-snap-gene-0.4-mRNA-1 annotation:"cys loop ligand gated ion channel subunit"